MLSHYIKPVTLTYLNLFEVFMYYVIDLDLDHDLDLDLDRSLIGYSIIKSTKCHKYQNNIPKIR